MALSSPIWAYAVDAIARALLPAPAKTASTGGSILKCPRCGAWTEVLETRAKEDNTTRRRYQCANMHRFTTIEFVRPDASKRVTPDRANKSAED